MPPREAKRHLELRRLQQRDQGVLGCRNEPRPFTGTVSDPGRYTTARHLGTQLAPTAPPLAHARRRPGWLRTGAPGPGNASIPATRLAAEFTD